MTDTFDRTQLDGKDREQLSEIASALGVKAISRMRKADLVEAIVSATSGANGSSSTGSSSTSESRPRKIRSTVSGGDDLASLAAEEDSLAIAREPVDEMALIRPRRSASAGNGSGDTPTHSSPPTASSPERMSSESTSVRDAGSESGGGEPDDHGSHHEPGSQTQQARRHDDGQGN